MAYTPFALLAAALLVSMAFSTPSDLGQEPINPAYSQSVEESWRITQGAYALEASRILAEDDSVSNYSESAANLTYEGVSGELQQDANFLNWSEKVEDLSNRVHQVKVSDLNVSTSNLSIVVKSDFRLELDDVNRSFQTTTYRQVSGVKDSLLTGTADRNITACSFDRIAYKPLSGYSDDNGTARGIPVNDTESIEDDEILVVENVSEFDSNKVLGMEGFFSTWKPENPSDYNDNYVIGDSVPEFQEGQRAIIHEGLWKSNFNRTRGNCYLPTSLNRAPGISERIEGEQTGDSDQGVFTVLQDFNSSESDIGFERVNEPGGVTGIQGVTSGEGKVWEKFNMSKELAEEQGLSDLIQ
jgi:hypothetical protein